MELWIISLILLPFIIAVAQFLIRSDRIRKVLTYGGSGLIMATALTLAVLWYMKGQDTLSLPNANGLLTEAIVPYIGYGMLGVELLLMCVVVWLSVRYKKFLIALLSMAQTGLMCWLELSGKIHESAGVIYLDRLSLLMCLIIAVVGGLICIYALGYMKDYHHFSLCL